MDQPIRNTCFAFVILVEVGCAKVTVSTGDVLYIVVSIVGQLVAVNLIIHRVHRLWWWRW